LIPEPEQQSTNPKSANQRMDLPPLRDRIHPGVRVLFVGINPGVRSSLTGHHFAGYSNRFWKLLHESGLVPDPITYECDDRLADWGFGVTNIVRRPSSRNRHVDASRVRSVAEENRPLSAEGRGDGWCHGLPRDVSGAERRCVPGLQRANQRCRGLRAPEPERPECELFVRRDAGGIHEPAPIPRASASRFHDLIVTDQPPRMDVFAASIAA